MRGPSFPRGGLAPAVLAPVFTAVVGLAFAVLSATQPAWLGDSIGPGLFARWLAASVGAVSCIWLGVELVRPRPTKEAERSGPERASSAAGVGLLGGVAAFAAAFPSLGLVAASALAALASAWGAGDRTWRDLAISVGVGAAAASAVGLALLPPGAPLWPKGF